MYACVYMCVYQQSGIILFRENSNIKSLKPWKRLNLWGFVLCMPVHDLTSSLAADKGVSIIFWKFLYFLRTHLTHCLLSSIQTHTITTHGLCQKGAETGWHKPPQDHAGLGTGYLGTCSLADTTTHLWFDTADEHVVIYRVRGFTRAAG